MKVTLQVNGREMTSSEEELIAIVKKHLSSETTQQKTTAKVAQKPTEDVWFEVKPQTIDQKLFEKERKDNWQETMRQRILEAFAEMKDNPEKYGKNFKTMMPKKTWSSRTVEQLKKMASKLGDHNADWVEQALEWAQRIANGESWESICNKRDTANWYRLVIWKSGYARRVGGSNDDNFDTPASDVYCIDYHDVCSISRAVPLVVLSSEEEPIAIVEKHLSSETTQQKITVKVAQKPTEDAWFEVKPQTIDQKLFEKERKDNGQEAMRQLILEAFAEMKDNPKKYGKNFKTMIPTKTWHSKTVQQLKIMAIKMGNHNADWVEQALEWAQRIANGESWEFICNKRDTANWFRLVVWKSGYARCVGGSVHGCSLRPASYVHNYDYRFYNDLRDTVPLVVLYE